MAISMLDRRIKYNGHKATINHTNKTINKNLDINVLNLLCSYVLCGNRNVRRGGFIHLRNFIECLNLDIYNNEPDKIDRINFIKKGLDARITKSLTSPVMILNFINGGFLEESLLNAENFTELSNDEIDFINDMVTQSLKTTFIDEDIDILADLVIRWKASDFQGRAGIQIELEEVINRLHSKFRQAKVEPIGQITFALREDKFEEAISDIYAKLIDPSRRLITGMQGFNELVGGALFSARVYMLLGITGIGKSISLLNICYQIKKYNKTFTPKDPTKRPCIVFLTMENDIVETVERLFQMSTGSNMEDFTLEEVIKKIKTEGELFVSDDSPVDIIIKFLPDRSIDTGYLYLLVEDLEDDGYEVICFALDHIKRIRSSSIQNDIRLELGAVVNECKTFASIKDIPFLTDSHLNRDANMIVDKGNMDKTGSNKDLTRLLGKGNIGESMLMLDNLDWCCILNVGYDSEGNKYHVFSRIKMRYKASNRDYINHPFESDNPIRYVEDIYDKVPAFRDSLSDSNYNELNVNTHMNTIRTSSYCNINVLDDSVEDIKPSFRTIYNANTEPEVNNNDIRNIRFMMTSTELEKESNNIAEALYRAPILIK